MNFMNYMNYDLVIAASQHHHDVTKHAAEWHFVRRSPRGPRSESLGPRHGRPDAC
jgi:hypothetical protein